MVAPTYLAAVVAALLLSTTAACGEPSDVDRPTEQAMPEITISQALEQNVDGLMALPGVVGTGQGECSGAPCIKVLVVEKTQDLLAQIPSEIEGYIVQVEESGEIKARGGG